MDEGHRCLEYCRQYQDLNFLGTLLKLPELVKQAFIPVDV